MPHERGPQQHVAPIQALDGQWRWTWYAVTARGTVVAGDEASRDEAIANVRAHDYRWSAT